MNIAAWFRDRAVRKVARFGVPIALGKMVASLSGLVTLGVLARYLGKERFGVIAMFRTVIAVVDAYANFNTWQAIVKYGTQAIADERPTELKKIIKLAFSIDAATAVLGFAVVAGVALSIPGRFDWSSRESMLCVLYGLVLVSKVAGTSDGIFRICDAYRAQAIVSSIGAMVITIVIVVSVVLDLGFSGCVLGMLVGEAASNLAATATSFWVARKAGYGGWLSTPLTGVRRDHPGILRFLVSTNAQLTVRTTQSELDMLVVGSMLGKAPAGLFRVVKQLGVIPARVFMPFEQVLFTELSRCAANRDYRGFRSLLRRTVAIGGGGSFLIWIVIAFGARILVQAVAGKGFVAAAEPFRWYLLAMVLQVSAAPVMRAMIALGRPGTLFLFDCASLVVLIVVVIGGAFTYGLVGVALAIVVHKAGQLLWSTTWVLRHLNRLERAEKAKSELVGGPASRS